LRANAHRYDIAVVHGIWQYHSLGTWRVLRQRGLPYVVYPHGALDPWFRRCHRLKHVKKWMYWQWAEYRVLRDAEAVLFTSEAERLAARESFRRYRAREMTVGGGTASPAGAAQQQTACFYHAFPELRGKRLVLYLGRLHPRKAADLVIRAFAAVMAADAGWHLVMAGPDPIHWKRRLVSLAESCGVGRRIAWIDMLAGDAKWGALRAADALCLPSHGENFSLAVAEALACGTPVLISDRVNVWREVEAAEAGLVAADTCEGACALLRQWLLLEGEQRRRMRRQARSCFEESFDVGKAAGRLADVLAGACAGRAARPQYALLRSGASPGVSPGQSG
jgi:glycosyltransferase involved in cell wall biosynthesis